MFDDMGAWTTGAFWGGVVFMVGLVYKWLTEPPKKPKKLPKHNAEAYAESMKYHKDPGDPRFAHKGRKPVKWGE